MTSESISNNIIARRTSGLLRGLHQIGCAGFNDLSTEIRRSARHPGTEFCRIDAAAAETPGCGCELSDSRDASPLWQADPYEQWPFEKEAAVVGTFTHSVTRADCELAFARRSTISVAINRHLRARGLRAFGYWGGHGWIRQKKKKTMQWGDWHVDGDLDDSLLRKMLWKRPRGSEWENEMKKMEMGFLPLYILLC